MYRKIYQPNEVIFLQGSYARTMYEIASGLVGIYAAYGTPDEQLLAELGPREFFGEMGLVECYPRSATAVALEADTSVIEIDSDDFSDFYKTQPDKVLAIMRQLSARLRDTNQKYQEACITIYDAIEAERAQKKRARSVGAKLSAMLQFFRQSGSHV